MSHFLDAAGTLSTIALLAVTYWYARTTKEMAKTSAEAAQISGRATEAAVASAHASERAAEAALDAASVAQSQIKPEFTGRFITVGGPNADPGEGIPCVMLRAEGDAVVVSGVWCRRGFRESDDGYNAELFIESEELLPYGETVIGRRLHRGETLMLTHPEFSAPGPPISRFILDIRYTFTEGGRAGAIKQLVFDATSSYNSR